MLLRAPQAATPRRPRTSNTNSWGPWTLPLVLKCQTHFQDSGSRLTIQIHVSSTIHRRPGRRSNTPLQHGGHKTARITYLQLMVLLFFSSSTVRISAPSTMLCQTGPAANGFIFWSHPVPESKGKWWMRLDGSSWTSFNTNTNASDTAVIKFFQQLQLVRFILRDWYHTFTTYSAR